MHDESMTDENRLRAAAESMEMRVVRALERQPEVNIPVGFAARVAARITVKEGTSKAEGSYRVTHYGRNVMLISMVVLLAAMMALASRAVTNPALWIGLEWTLCAEFVVLTLWFSMRRDRLS